jgi:hypothetical protein
LRISLFPRGIPFETSVSAFVAAASFCFVSVNDGIIICGFVKKTRENGGGCVLVAPISSARDVMTKKKVKKKERKEQRKGKKDSNPFTVHMLLLWFSGWYSIYRFI